MDTEEKVVCQICGSEFKFISTSHLKSRHGINVMEYKKKFPGSKIITDFHKQKFHKSYNTSNEIKDESFIEKIPKIEYSKNTEELDLFSKIDTLKKCNVIESKYFNNPNNSIPKDKLGILNYLVRVFPEHKIENNYFIEKFYLETLEYRLVTDISIPSLKIDLEFPNSFWHNFDRPKEVRDYILENNKWTIINIIEKIPNISLVEKAIKNYLKN